VEAFMASGLRNGEKYIERNNGISWEPCLRDEGIQESAADPVDFRQSGAALIA
jgi:hypothetical protein